MSDTIQRMGILTGGGDCPGLNAVIRAAVKTARSAKNCTGLGGGFGHAFGNDGNVLTGAHQVAEHASGKLIRSSDVLDVAGRS